MRRIATRLAVVLVGLCLAFSLAELGLRLFPEMLSEQTRLRLHWAALDADERTTVAHPTIGYVARSGIAETLEHTDLRFRYTIDGNGFRNPWPWPERADVVVTGDSLAFGYGVDDGQGWTDRLRLRFPTLSLVNLGIVGAAPQMGLAAFDAYGVPLEPKLHVLCLFPGNDVYDAQEFEHWQASGAGGNFGVWRTLGGREPSAGGRLFDRIEGSYLFQALWNISRTESHSSTTLELAGGGRVQLVPDILATAEITDPSSEDFLRILRPIERAVVRAAVHGTHTLVLCFPTKEEVYLPLTEDVAPNVIGPFRDVLLERGIEVLDLTPALQAAAREGRQLFYEIDGHPNAAGYALIGDVVAEHLRGNAQRYGLEL